MNEAKARKILGSAIKEDGSLYYERDDKNIRWPMNDAWQIDRVYLSDVFKVEELEAIVWCIRNKVGDINTNDSVYTDRRDSMGGPYRMILKAPGVEDAGTQ